MTSPRNKPQAVRIVGGRFLRDALDECARDLPARVQLAIQNEVRRSVRGKKRVSSRRVTVQ